MNPVETLRNRSRSNNKHWRKAGADETNCPSLEALLPIGDAFGVGFVRTVDARSLHAALGVGRDFSTWITGRISKYGFRRGVDYTTLTESGEPGNNGFTQAIEYFITVDMGKELAMVENNPVGMRVRRYFIDAERQLRAVRVPTTLEGALELALDTERKRLALVAQVEVLEPKAAFADAVTATDDTIDMATAAQKLGMGRNRLFLALRSADVLIKHGQRYNMPYQHHIDEGRFQVVTGLHTRPDGEHSHSTVRVTPKGLEFLFRTINR